jgi:hypothetical protein
MSDKYYQFNPFFDQEGPVAEISGMIASLDISPSWELDAAAVFKTGRQYLVVFVSGCSCWPDRGGTQQIVCPTKADVDKAITGQYRSLLQSCQDADWKVTKPLVESA